MSDQQENFEGKSKEKEDVLVATSDNDLTLPSSVTVLDAPLNGKVYIVGTAHFSVKSQQEVAEVIRKVRPNYVMLELCSSRSNMLVLDEETIMRESREMNLTKIKQLIKSSNATQGILQALMIRFYAQITEQLGIAPGGEFRVAYNEARKIPGCRVYLGDMPINITLKRSFHSLPWYRKVKLVVTMLFANTKITKEDMEKLKEKDILESLVEEFGASFPEFKRVLIDERDICLAHSLRTAADTSSNELVQGGQSPVKVVGVVGLGHVAGIVKNWNKELDVTQILKLPEPSNFGKYMKYSIAGLACIMCFKYFSRNLKFLNRS